MYIRLKWRKLMNDESVAYLYLCESKRVEGKVINTQKYLLSIKQQDVMKLNTKVNAEELGIDQHVVQMIEKKLCL